MDREPMTDIEELDFLLGDWCERLSPVEREMCEHGYGPVEGWNGFPASCAMLVHMAAVAVIDEGDRLREYQTTLSTHREYVRDNLILAAAESRMRKSGQLNPDD